MSACGTEKGLAAHKRRNERPCKWCLPLMDQPVVKERKRMGPPKGIIVSGRPLAPCGTPAAYRRHHHRGETIDDACKDAARIDRAKRKAAAKKAGTQ